MHPPQQCFSQSIPPEGKKKQRSGRYSKTPSSKKQRCKMPCQTKTLKNCWKNSCPVIKHYKLTDNESVPSVIWHYWLGARKSIQHVKIEWWSVGVVICLERGAYCCKWSSWCHCHPKTPSSLASIKSRLVFPFFYRLSQAATKKNVRCKMSHMIKSGSIANGVSLSVTSQNCLTIVWYFTTLKSN